MDFAAFHKIEVASTSTQDQRVQATFVAIQTAIHRLAFNDLDALASEFWSAYQAYQARAQTATTLMRKARAKAQIIGDYEISYSSDIQMYHIINVKHPCFKAMRAAEAKTSLLSILAAGAQPANT